ncbi:MAG: hypothetical protein ACREM6_03040 [Vulcanimicrobiaceae bacterium]
MIRGAALGMLAVLLAVTPSPQPAAGPLVSTPDALAVVQTLTQRNAALRSYTFDVHVHVVLHTFPYLKFRLEGDGRYERPSLFSVHFHHVPWFGKGFERMNMGPLDPKNWPTQYTMRIAEQVGDQTLLSFTDRNKSPLTTATALIDPTTGVQELVWKYSYGGRVQLDVHPVAIDGYQLPATEDAEIAMPRYKVSMHADFSNYHVVSDDPLAASAQAALPAPSP